MSGMLQNGVCIGCGNKPKYNEQFDAYYCKYCDVWLESKCPDINCEFCYNRPIKPSGEDDEQR